MVFTLMHRSTQWLTSILCPKMSVSVWVHTFPMVELLLIQLQKTGFLCTLSSREMDFVQLEAGRWTLAPHLQTEINL